MIKINSKSWHSSSYMATHKPFWAENKAKIVSRLDHSGYYLNIEEVVHHLLVQDPNSRISPLYIRCQPLNISISKISQYFNININISISRISLLYIRCQCLHPELIWKKCGSAVVAVAWNFEINLFIQICGDVWIESGWQKLADFRRWHKWPSKFSSGAYLLFSRQIRRFWA